MAKRFQYRARVEVSGGCEETIFVPAEEGAPRVPARYVTDADDHGRFRDGETYLVNPGRVEDAEHVPAAGARPKPKPKPSRKQQAETQPQQQAE